jgi:transcriptional regulator with GAF, ATPase, and Fis domain
MAEPATTDLDQLDAFHALLPALAGALDIRDVFRQLSAVASRIVPHDEANLMLATDDGTQYRLYASTREGAPELVCRDDHCVLREPIAARLMDAVPGPERGLRSGVCTPVLIGDAVVGVFALFSRRPHAYSPQDLALVQRLAGYIAVGLAHQRLAEAARHVAEAQARAERLESRVQSLVEELESKTGYARVVGQSPEWIDTLRKAAQVAKTEATVLLIGESGTGKEIVARFIHRASARKGGPFIALNCAALPEQLLESELFGYERGAFTGAQQSKPGHIEVAAGGVLFLDEVSEMSRSAQAKFLRVLQEREFSRLGGTRLHKANVRIIAASNRDLRKAVERGDFREDLFYRLQVFDIRLPPLRERRSDIVLLSDAFLQEIAKSFGRPLAGLTRDAREALLRHDWPGNVRELRNALERAAILCEGGLIGPQHLSLYTPPPPVQAATTDLNAVERKTIAAVMRECRGNKSKAAKRLGLSRTQLYGRLRKYELDRPSASPAPAVDVPYRFGDHTTQEREA